ncbi:MAG: ribosome biogenesis GTPase Der [Candidatus Omnitrophica bacterium]|nr:ribosome biogenesis GTPase Der [Candidatus Omnitrophota bacterium]
MRHKKEQVPDINGSGMPTVTIVGRPNVGKSSLFNRILGRRHAIVEHASGTTRDRIIASVEKDGSIFNLVDTGGFVRKDADEMAHSVKRQIKLAVEESDLLLFVCDAIDGITRLDEEFVPILRQSGKNVLLIANKVDNEKMEEDVMQFYQLGFDHLFAVSALHNRGIDEILSHIVSGLKPSPPGAPQEEYLKIAIVGRPNVGKSSFLNFCLGTERVLVDDKPGTTRDSIDTICEIDGTKYLLIDTAGIRHKRKIKEAVDVYSIMRAEEAVRRSQVVLLLIDGYDGLRKDDIRILDFALKAGSGLILVVNKWDLVKELPMSDYMDMLRERFKKIELYPVIFTSAKTGRNVLKAMALAETIEENRKRRIPTHRLNEILKNFKKYFPMNVKAQFMTQVETSPPRFLIFVNNTKDVRADTINRLERVLRREFDFSGTPLRFDLKKKRSLR